MGWVTATGRACARILVATFALLVVRPASAETSPRRAPTLVFESHVGERTAAVAAVLEMLGDALETHGFVARPATFERLLGGRAPRPGIEDPSKTAAEIAQQVTAGLHAYVMGDFDKAVGTLTGAIESIHHNPGLFVIDTENADTLTRAYMALTLALSRLGRVDESVATMKELIRITRGQPISRAEFGPDADKLYRTVLKQVQGLGRGSLTITTGDDRAMIFVDGSLRGMGKATLGDLIPGRYRVFVQVPSTHGRRYSIEVMADEDHYLDVKSEIEEVLWITPAWVGFRFTTEAERKQEARFASALARAWTGEGMVVVIGPTRLQDKPALFGTLYRTDGTVVRSASVETDGADRDRLRSLAKFIADGTPDEGLEILNARKRDETPALHTTVDTTSGAALWPKLVTLGGLAALAAGVTLLAIDEDPDPVGPQQPTYRDTLPAGIVVGTLGIAAAGVGVWYWLRLRDRPDDTGGPAITLGPGRAFVAWGMPF